MSARNPSTWEEYDRGASPHRQGSVSSAGARSRGSAQPEDESLLDGDDNDEAGDDVEWPGRLRRRRSSVTNRLTALTDIGGVNSIRSFTRSWARAAGFTEVIPQRPSFVFAPDQAPLGAPSEEDDIEYGRTPVLESGPGQRTSLLRQHLEARRASAAVQEQEEPGPSDGDARNGRPEEESFRDRERKSLGAELLQAPQTGSVARSMSIFAIPPHLATPSVGSYGSYRGSVSFRPGSYGTILPSPTGSPFAETPPPVVEVDGVPAEGLAGPGPDDEVQPILVKEVEQDGKMVLTVEGQSTLPQTIFNSINVLIGVGLLSLPMGIRYAGWVCGMGFLTFAAAVTAYTASLLARCMDLDASLITFSDLAFISFGHRARIATSVLFTLELLAACVALIVLFADSLDLLFPGLLTVVQWKVVCALILLPLHFMPLRLLSYTSIVGIVSCFSIVLIVVVDGLGKTTSPGSLIQPAATYMFPANWLTLPLSFGLLMSPWGGHGVFPNIYRDMRHPYKYGQALKVTFSFTYLLDATTAVAGILMFGDDVLDAITSNILTTSGYPVALTFLMCAFIAIIPLTKIPLNARPIITTLEVLLGVYTQPNQQQQNSSDGASGPGPEHTILKAAIRVFTILMFLIISILFPAFDRIMAFMGSALCFTICVTLPIAFYLKLFGREISAREKTVAWLLMLGSAALSLVGTVWAFLPRHLIDAV